MRVGELRARGNHVVIKTHQWSDAWEVKQADHIFLTHRDLQGVVASYRRVGWASDIPDSYVDGHQQWRVILMKKHCPVTGKPCQPLHILLYTLSGQKGFPVRWPAAHKSMSVALFISQLPLPFFCLSARVKSYQNPLVMHVSREIV